ncbi:MAG: 30S ribosomal protein S6e [Nanoarchaeota archaeon]
MEFKFVINDPKAGKSYSKVVNDDLLIGKKIGDMVSGGSLGLAGYELKITGGTDKAGFPMRPDIQGTVRKRLMLKKGDVGIRIKERGILYRKIIVGNTVSQNTAQINLTITKHGTKSIEELLGIKPKEEAKSEEKKEVKIEAK